MEIVLDDGYQFGLGVFETIAVEKSRLLFLDWHLERMAHSLRELGIRQTVTKRQVTEYLTSHRTDRAALKIMVSDKNIVFTMRPNPYTAEKAGKGFRLLYSSVYRNETSPLVGHKTMNYGDCLLEKRRTALMGADELIFLNSRGEICEGTVSNIFFVSGGRLFTPPVSCGLLPGIVRRFVMESFSVTEQVLRREDAAKMEECFVTNSLMGIMPVVALGETVFHKRTVTERCRRVYEQTIAFYTRERCDFIRNFVLTEIEEALTR
ncbi:MAG TPA: branched-chain amino acid aminotransferase [Lachnospiraceae bacterium]|nr:branched-chain amino acid aminotransferase [Lachnospiraceae bacterium]